MRVALLGYGKTTKAIASKFKKCIFFDDNTTKEYRDKNGFTIKPSDMYCSDEFDISVPSPGIAPHNKLIKSATNLISEYDLLIKESQKSVWITGTNGKTTTTQMLEHLLQDRGAISGGNIGTPLASLDPNSPLWLLETSSFSLHYTKDVTPDLFISLPITPDHLNWHGTKESYIRDKLSVIERMREGEPIIIPRKFLSDINTSGFVITYDDSHSLAKYFDIDISKIRFSGVFLLDALLAMAATKILYDEIDYDKINCFKLQAHRQEEFVDAKTRVWVNDSKATNIDAAIGAIDRYSTKKLHIIIGGDNKGVDLTPLFAHLKPLNTTIYLIGKEAEELSKIAKKESLDYKLSHTIKNAVDSIDKVLTTESIALLSPASASFDQYSSYTQRGDDFKNCIKNL